jgi:hypothetical protein
MGGMNAVICDNCANALAFRMLEDPSYESIVRWGEGGESFVVLEVWLRIIQVLAAY